MLGMANGLSTNRFSERVNPVVMVLFGNLLVIEVYSNGFIVVEEKVQLFVKSGYLDYVSVNELFEKGDNCRSLSRFPAMFFLQLI